MTIKIVQGDALALLKTMRSEVVNCVVTSPPYWGLRNYNVEGQIGLEPTWQQYVERLVGIFHEARRVLRSDGTLWLNIGDNYNQGRSGGHGATGGLDKSTLSSAAPINQTPTRKGFDKKLGAKQLIGIPWRVAFALQADGWYLRQDNIWSKPNPMPESVTDRTTRSHEYMFHFSKSPRYYYDADAIKEPPKESSIKRVTQKTFDQQTGGEKDYGPNSNRSMRKTVENFAKTIHNPVFGGNNKHVGYGTRRHSGNEDSGNEDSGNEDSGKYLSKGVNKRSVWHIAPKPYREAHFATFPPDLVRPCILAGCPVDGVVLDPFAGSGTVGMVANELRRHAILLELNGQYVEMAKRRCGLSDAAPIAAE